MHFKLKKVNMRFKKNAEVFEKNKLVLVLIRQGLLQKNILSEKYPLSWRNYG